MLLIYNKKTGKIVGVSMIISDTSGVIPQPNMENVDFKIKGVEGYILPDDESVLRDMHNYTLELDNEGNPIGFVRKEVLKIELSTDATDTNGDGVAEIPAGGASCNLIASVRNEYGKIIKERPFRIQFITTGGILREYLTETRNGVARVQITSVPETKRVHVIARADGCMPGELDLDFVFVAVPPR
jgi:hypothetical protein